MSTQSSIRRIVAGLGGLALVVGGLALSSTAASAVTTDVGPGQPGAPTSGSLTIHKYAGSTTGDINNGTQQEISRPPLGGITFTATRVGKTDGGSCVALDLTTAGGWTDTAAALGSKPPAAPYCLTSTSYSGTTDAAGTLPLTGMALGLYYVTEAPAPNVTPESSIPFYVSIPYPSQSGDTATWLYDVHVYPKNTLTGDGSKVVADPGTNGLGSTVPWTVQTRPLGSFNDGAPLTSYSIVDPLDSRLSYEPTATLQYQTPLGSLTDVDPANYTLTTPTVSGKVTLTATLNTSWVNTLPAGTYFVLAFNTVVTGPGDIVNEGFENTGGENVKIGEASTQWGPVKLLKHKAGNEDQGLKGAVFEVYNTSDGCATLGAQISVNGASTFSSGDTGIVDIAGLYVGKNGAPGERVYCVKEITPPAGYQLNPAPIPVTVKAETTASITYKVPNAPVAGPALPLTGSSGTLAFGIVGLGLIAAAGTVLAVRRARAKQQR